VLEQLVVESPTRPGTWVVYPRRWRDRIGVIVAVAIVHIILIWLGYRLREAGNVPAVLWPAAGLSFVALRLCTISLWPALIASQLAVELGMRVFLQHPFVPQIAVLFTATNGVSALIAVIIVRLLVSDITQTHLRLPLYFFLATATGALCAAVMGVTLRYGSIPSTLNNMNVLQVWWAGNWLGAITIAPVIFYWFPPMRSRQSELTRRSAVELAVVSLLLMSAAAYVFSATSGAASSLLQLPVVPAVLLTYAAFRFPARWSATLAALTILLCAGLASGSRGPFVGASDPFTRIAAVQGFLMLLAGLTPFISLLALANKRALARLRTSDARYREFVQFSTEAIWRVELKSPMPLTLPLEEQVQWLRQHAQIAEFSQSYRDIDPAAQYGAALPWRSELAWCAVVESQLSEVSQHGVSKGELRIASDARDQRRTFMVSFYGVVQQGALRRIWGVARDISELMKLNTRLLREQERLRTYAKQIVTAEEKARRATAVDLHDGIGQTLVGMAMSLEVAREQAAPDVRLLLEEMRRNLNDVQDRTRHMISDLSPPGLYELGLGPALQWLVVYVRGQNQLQVELESQVEEGAIDLSTRVLVFKLVRELLRNVVKHAGVKKAKVLVICEDEQLRAEVSDQGRGFEWQLDMFGAAGGGFGLWSIAGRVSEAGGTFHVETAPGRGSRFEMIFPLRASPAVADSGQYLLQD
jgi:signal transduction histidine kinase